MSDNLTDRMIYDIRMELEAARTKFPTNKHQLTAFNEEAGELNKALLEHEYGGKVPVTAFDVYREAIQAATMAIRVGTEGDDTFEYDPNLAHTQTV